MGVHDPRTMQTIENVFDLFCSANTMHGILSSFNNLCSLLGINSSERRHLFSIMQGKLAHYWKAKALFIKLSKRADHKEYGRGLLCHGMNAVIIGAGPCGLRTSIELALLGASVTVLEKRDKFSRNNVLHLWPYLIDDLRSLGAKKFFGKFCFGSIDHISIRTLQCILLKVALIFGVRVIPEVEFESIVEPKSPNEGWRLKTKGKDVAYLRDLEVKLLVGADGKRNTLPGFHHKQFRAKLAIAITVNFLNKHSQEEALVKEISGLSFIFNQKFFMDLKERAGIDLENIVYYKDETHYFVMTAKKACLVSKGVLREDFDDPDKLLDRENINKDALLNFAQEAALESTYRTLPHVDFALNQYGQPDVAVFDFTSLFAAEHASRLVERHGKQLLMCLVGDSLLEPFWPTGSGCARGFLGAFDAAWMVRRFGMGKMNTLEFLAERESIFQRLSQTESDKMNKSYSSYTIDPRSRYPGLDAFCVRPRQITHLYDTDRPEVIENMLKDIASRTPTKLLHSAESNHQRVSNKDELNFDRCLRWFQVKLHSYANLIEVKDLSESWFSGVGFLCLIHLYRPDLIDLQLIVPNDAYENITKSFDILEREFGIAPLLSVDEFLKARDQLTMWSYLELVYETLRGLRPAKENRAMGRAVPRRWRGSLSLANRINAHNKVRRDQQEVEFDRIKRHQTRDHEDIASGLANKRQQLLKEALTQDLIEPAPCMDVNTRRSLHALTTVNKGKVNNLAQKLFAPPVASDSTPTPPSQVKRSKVVIPEALLNMVGEGGAQPPAYRPQSGPQTRTGAVARAIAARSAAGGGRTQSSSDRCYFCGQQVYLVERMSAEGYFFHRGCLKCAECGTRLRLSTYVFHRTADGRGIFYCFAHYAVRHAGEVSRDLRDYYDDTLYDTAGLQTEGSLPSSRNNNFRTPERAEFQYYAEELREVDEASICDYNRLSVDYLEDDDEEDDEVMDDEDEEGTSRRHFDRNRKFSWENAVEAARRIATKRVAGGAFDAGSSTDLDSTSAGGIDLSDTELEDEQMPEEMAARPGPVQAPIIHRDSSAKMKFYMEAPKPVQINARHFFAKSNLIKLTHSVTEEIAEVAEPLSDPQPETVAPCLAVAPSAGRLTRLDAPPVAAAVGEHAARVTVSDYFAERWEQCCELEPAPEVMGISAVASSPTASASLTLEEGEALQSESHTEEASPVLLPPPVLLAPPHAVPMVPLAFEDLSDIHDIDSSSVPTENSCASEPDLPEPPAARTTRPSTLAADAHSRRSREVSTHSLYSSASCSSVDSAPLKDAERRRKISAHAAVVDERPPPAAEDKEETFAAEVGRKKIQVALSSASSVEQLAVATGGLALDEPVYENLPLATATGGPALDEPVYENLQRATAETLERVYNPLYDAVEFPLMDDSSAHLSSTNEERSKSSLPVTDSSLPLSPNLTRRRRKRRMRKTKGKLSSAAGGGSVDSSLNDTSAGDEEPRRGGKRSSVPLLGRWKGWFSSSSSTGHRRSKHRSLDADEELAAAAAQPPNPPPAPPTEEDEEAIRQRRRRQQLERERELFEIQCQLEDVELRLRQLEDRGVLAEQSIRSSTEHDAVDNNAMTDWMTLIGERNQLLQLESELTVSARELELTWRQECLEEQYRRRMTMPEEDKSPEEKAEEQQLLDEMIKVVEERNSLVGYLDEMRLEEAKEKSEANTPVDGKELSVRDMILMGATQESKLI